MAKIVTQDTEKAARIIGDAGGKIVGRTRLQKLAYFLEVVGLGDNFDFEYRHYGPFSEQLADALATATRLGLVKEEERITNWGGTYSIFNTDPSVETNKSRKELIELAIQSDPIALELAATAVFLASEGYSDAWVETERRKPEKADRLAQAKALYQKLRTVETPIPLPALTDFNRLSLTAVELPRTSQAGTSFD